VNTQWGLVILIIVVFVFLGGGYWYLQQNALLPSFRVEQQWKEHVTEAGLRFEVPKEWSVSRRDRVLTSPSGNYPLQSLTKAVSPDYAFDGSLEPEDSFSVVTSGVSFVAYDPTVADPSYTPQTLVDRLRDVGCDSFHVRCEINTVAGTPAYVVVDENKTEIMFLHGGHIYRMEFYFPSFNTEIQNFIEEFIKRIGFIDDLKTSQTPAVSDRFLIRKDGGSLAETGPNAQANDYTSGGFTLLSPTPGENVQPPLVIRGRIPRTWLEPDRFNSEFLNFGVTIYRDGENIYSARMDVKDDISKPPSLPFEETIDPGGIDGSYQICSGALTLVIESGYSVAPQQSHSVTFSCGE
jgi:hypothetical protein